MYHSRSDKFALEAFSLAFAMSSGSVSDAGAFSVRLIRSIFPPQSIDQKPTTGGNFRTF
jgi:hypothetical protein